MWALLYTFEPRLGMTKEQIEVTRMASNLSKQTTERATTLEIATALKALELAREVSERAAVLARETVAKASQLAQTAIANAEAVTEKSIRNMDTVNGMIGGVLKTIESLILRIERMELVIKELAGTKTSIKITSELPVLVK